MADSYWTSILGQRMRRRQAMAMAGGTAAGAALLAACGGSDSGSSKPSGGGDAKDAKGNNLVAKPVDTTKTAVRGGSFKDRATGDPNTLDIANAVNPLNISARLAYNTLVRVNAGTLKPSDNTIGPDLAESWETTPDGLQITMKLRQGVKWHNIAPVNGRTLDANDVLFTWDRFSKKSSNRGGLVNSVNPQAPVLSLTSPDAKTIVIKLKEPLVYALDLFASNTASHSGSVLIIPKEADSGYNIGTDMIGAGPFYMSKYEPSVGFTMKRHPDYYDKDWALVDQIDLPIIVQNASVLSQVQAGNLLTYSTYTYGNQAIAGEDVMPLKQAQPDIQIYATDLASSTNVFCFGWLPAGKSPFQDERVRQAVSMGWDRDLWIDTFQNVSKFQAQGLPVETRWSSALTPTWDGWWLDPQGKEFGENAKYFKRDIAEAKKLLAAAGFANGIKDLPSNHIVTNELGPLPKYADVLDGMLTDIGITTKTNPVDYAKDYIPNLRDGHGQYQGWAYATTAGGTGVGPVGLLANEYWSKGGSAFRGFSANGQNDQSGDPSIDSLISKARLEQDVEKRRGLVKDVQRALGKAMYGLLIPGGSTGYTVAWPALRNFRVFSGPQVWSQYRLWVDQTLPPFKKS